MSSNRKEYAPPSYCLYEDPKELQLLYNEIKKFKPEVEVTLENSNEKATGIIEEWHSSRKFFSVKWKLKSKNFDQVVESDSSLRIYFKGRLFSAQVLFKSNTLRRFDTKTSHFRIPEQIFKQQRRAGLRVPIQNGSAKLITQIGKFQIIDLSLTGAMILAPSHKINSDYQNIILESCEIILNNTIISPSGFNVKIIRIHNLSIGVKFQGLSRTNQNRIKQYLIEQLRVFYENIKTHSNLKRKP